MKQHNPSERGQALVLIAFAILGLLALTALAIDGGNVYSDRRNAQNAADTAVYAAALNMVRNTDTSSGAANEDWTQSKQAARARAASNGYDNDGIGDIVDVEIPPVSGVYSDCSSTEFDCNEYVQVIITSNVNTYFAPIVGITKLTNQVNAVAHVEPTIQTPFALGNAMVSLNQTKCPAVTLTGGADVVLDGGGLFINSDCSDNTNKDALTFGGTGNLDAPTLCSVGPYETGGLDLADIEINPACETKDPATAFIPPNFENACPNPVSEDPDDSTLLLPGEFSDNSKSFPPSGIDELASGVYCVTSSKGFQMTSGTLYGDQVVIYVEQGVITINTDGVSLHAPSWGPYEGLLFATPASNTSAVTINGNASNSFTGTILVPGSEATINGGSTTEGFKNTQVIADLLNVAGGSASSIIYDAEKAYKPQVPPNIQLME